eukprot:gene38649-52218_t
MVKIHWGISLAALAVASLPMAAMAQEAKSTPAPADEQGIPDIVVTAQKRAENVQDVPIAITAFTASALKERAIGDVSQLSAITPNVNLDGGTPFSGSSAVLSAFIRGIGADDFAFNIDPGVGVYVDGVYLARTVGANQDLLDVDRIEVLKGPQGTLFGRNTIGGAISIVTRDPGSKFRFTGDVTTGSYHLLQVRGSADIPIAANLNSSITFGVKQQDGYLQRVPYPDARAANEQVVLAVQTALGRGGYYDGPRDGVLTSQTEYSLSRFQHDRQLPAGWTVGTLQALGQEGQVCVEHEIHQGRGHGARLAAGQWRGLDLQPDAAGAGGAPKPLHRNPVALRPHGM